MRPVQPRLECRAWAWQGRLELGPESLFCCAIGWVAWSERETGGVGLPSLHASRRTGLVGQERVLRIRSDQISGVTILHQVGVRGQVTASRADGMEQNGTSLRENRALAHA